MRTRAKETTFTVKFNSNWRGRKLLDIYNEVFNMFDDVLAQATAGYDSDDIGRVVIHHDDIEPIVISLRKITELTSECIMEHVVNVLNSHQELSLDSSFMISIGLIALPRGGTNRRYLTKLRGPDNSIAKKRSMVQIVNDDNMCLARAIAVGWAQHHIVSKSEWEAIKKERKVGQRNLDLILEHKAMPRSHYIHVRTKGHQAQKELAEIFMQMANLPLNRKGEYC